MAKLKLGAIADDKPVKLTIELSARRSPRPRRLRPDPGARDRADRDGTRKTNRADVGAVHGNRPRFAKLRRASSPSTLG